jgi:large subunit ribosomal protein L4
MIKVKVYNLEGKEIEEIKLDPQVFGIEPNLALVHQVVEAQRANARYKLAHTKTKAEVRGGGIKPWRQKGTGRARAGSIRSPLWSGGGVTFGPRKERNFSKKINRKMKTKALFMTLTDKVKENCIIVLENLALTKIKTKDLANALHKLGTKKAATLVVLTDKNEIITKSARNIKKIKTILANSLNVLDILKYKYFVVDKAGIKKIVETYKK